MYIWNTLVTSGLVPLVATWNCKTRYKNEYAALLVLHLLLLLNPWFIFKMWPANVFYIGILWQMFFGTGSTGSISFSQGRSTHYSDRLNDFCFSIPRCYNDVHVNSFFPCTARLWNSLPIKCFPLTYDLRGFKSRIIRHLLTVGSF